MEREFAQLRTAVTDMRADRKIGLADKPGTTCMWGVLIAYACGLAALAILK